MYGNSCSRLDSAVLLSMLMSFAGSGVVAYTTVYFGDGRRSSNDERNESNS